MGGMSQTAVLPDTRPQGTDRTGDDEPKMFHYVRKSKIAESAVMGNYVVALCGETFPVTKSAKPGSPVCPDCKRIYERMRDEAVAAAVSITAPLFLLVMIFQRQIVSGLTAGAVKG